MSHSVLFVDDEVNILKAVERLLRREPYRVLLAASGAEAIELVIRERPEVVVSDLDMPDCNGLDLVREIQRREPDIVPILMTGGASPEALAAEHHGEIFRILPKPWETDDLKTTLLAACDHFDGQHDRPTWLGAPGAHPPARHG